MFRVVTALLVMAIVASPAAQFLCDVRCESVSHAHCADSTGCHDSHRYEQTLQPVTPTCERLGVADSFLTETSYRALVSVNPPGTGAAASASSFDLHDTSEPLLSAVAGLPPAGRAVTILRI